MVRLTVGGGHEQRVGARQDVGLALKLLRWRPGRRREPGQVSDAVGGAASASPASGESERGQGNDGSV